ncbi:MAG: hypothetical protein ACK40S_04455 [Burkholderiaceae bacterium]
MRKAVLQRLQSQFQGQCVIEARQLEQTLRSQPVRHALEGWRRLSHAEPACRLDRIVV